MVRFRGMVEARRIRKSGVRFAWALFLLILPAPLVAGQTFGGAEAETNLFRPGATNELTVVSDFDGDLKPDRATIRPRGHLYQLQVQLTTRQNPDSFSVSFADAESTFRLYAVDIDRDQDIDLVLVSSSALEPPAVWLNDGEGNFDRTERWWMLAWQRDRLQGEQLGSHGTSDKVSSAPLRRISVHLTRLQPLDRFESPVTVSSHRKSFLGRPSSPAFSPRAPPSHA